MCAPRTGRMAPPGASGGMGGTRWGGIGGVMDRQGNGMVGWYHEVLRDMVGFWPMASRYWRGLRHVDQVSYTQSKLCLQRLA